jgi:phage protein D
MVNLSTQVVLFVNGKVPQVLNRDYISIELTDEVGLMADTLSIRLSSGHTRPKGNDEITLFINGIDYGKFAVQETQKSDKELIIKARSANFATSLKERKNRAWENLKLCELVAKIAKEHNLKSKCKTTLFIDHLSQNHESDLNLLMRISKKYNLHFNIKNGTILLLSRKEYENLPLFVITNKEHIRYSITYSTKPLYASCKALWHDTKWGRIKELLVGKGKPQLLLQRSFKNEADARESATAALENMTQGTISGRIEIPGKEIRAGGKLNLIGFNEDDGIYTIKKTHHRIGSNGYTIEVEFTK